MADGAETDRQDSGAGDHGQQWAGVRARLRAEFGDATFNSWLKPLAVITTSGPVAKLTVPTRFMRDWVINHYFDRIRELWVAEHGDVRRVDIEVRPLARPRPKSDQDGASLPVEGVTKGAPRAFSSPRSASVASAWPSR